MLHPESGCVRQKRRNCPRLLGDGRRVSSVEPENWPPSPCVATVPTLAGSGFPVKADVPTGGQLRLRPVPGHSCCLSIGQLTFFISSSDLIGAFGHRPHRWRGTFSEAMRKRKRTSLAWEFPNISALNVDSKLARLLLQGHPQNRPQVTGTAMFLERLT